MYQVHSAGVVTQVDSADISYMACKRLANGAAAERQNLQSYGQQAELELHAQASMLRPTKPEPHR